MMIVIKIMQIKAKKNEKKIMIMLEMEKNGGENNNGD